MDFTDKRVLVTGSTRGIGRATARAFVDLGARVAVNGRSAAAVNDAIGAWGNRERLFPAPGDIGSVAGCVDVVRSAIEAFGGLDVLVNNAGVANGGPISEVDETEWDRILDTNLKGTFFTSQAALDALRDSGGNIVNVASDAGLMGSPQIVVYCASKGGVVNMTRAMALELAPEIRVNCVCPGYVDTDMVRRDYIELSEDPAAVEREIVDGMPLGRMASPEEVARAIIYLASEDARFVTGAALQIDGGTTAGR